MWLKQTFTDADKNGDGCLSIGEVLQLLHKLNVNLPRQRVKQMFEEADTDDNQGMLAFEEFCTFYKTMSTRRDLYLLLLTYSNQKDYMDTEDLIRFLENTQKMSSVTRRYCQEIVRRFEPCPENKDLQVLGIDGFTNYLRSPAGDIFNPEHHEVNQDMTQPLTNYFINSSHNTYLTGDQLLSQSRVDMYAYVLQAGCRCVEVDCWDGPDGEPIVRHGYTLTSKILFKDVIETINKYAFSKSQYPVILSIENHCTVPQQKKMAQYLLEVLQDKLDLSSINMNECKRLPSPEMLKGKILVKGKKLPANIDANAEEGDVSDEDSGEETDDEGKSTGGNSKGEDGTDGTDGNEPNPGTNERLRRCFVGSFKRKKRRVKLKKRSSIEDTDTDQESSSSAPRGAVVHYSRRRRTMRLARALSDLVKYTKSVRVHDIETQASTCSWQVSSLSETQANQIMQLKPTQFVRFNQRQLLRVYPSSYRVDSSNYNPQPFWNSGCHLVALNYQSEGRVLQLNRAKFSSNGNCGYILKPKCMCKGAFNPLLVGSMQDQPRKQLVLKIISGQQLPKPKGSMLGDRGEIIDPYVEVEIIGLPVDCCKNRTRVVDDNGFDPMWEETLVFTLHMPQIALVRFIVWDHDPIGRDFIGQRTIAFTSMLSGYRHVHLEGMEEASIFVHVAVNDISCKVKPTSGIKGMFHRNQNHRPLDSNTFVQHKRKRTFREKFLLRTPSPTPARAHLKNRRGGCKLSADGTSSDSEPEREQYERHTPRNLTDGVSAGRLVQSEPLKRAHRVPVQDSAEKGQRLINRRSTHSPNGESAASGCIRWPVSSKENNSQENGSESVCLQPEPHPETDKRTASESQTRLQLPPSPWTNRTLDPQRNSSTSSPHPRKAWSWSMPRRKPSTPQPPAQDGRSSLKWSRTECVGIGRRLAKATFDSQSLYGSDSSSTDSLDNIEFLPSRWPNDRRPAVGTLQREMSALFDQRMDEIRSKSPIYFTGSN
ncbi:hypothetical protein GJAV_G00172310 [Gymnothorax javanicus]|nr:hypothetical protein GJAV_G00172310 [Gymnothorax javanicus]